jgi:hypothetical protein
MYMLSTMPYSSSPFSVIRVFYPVIPDSPEPPDGGLPDSPDIPPPISNRQRYLNSIKETFTEHNTVQVNLGAIWNRHSGSVANFSNG